MNSLLTNSSFPLIRYSIGDVTRVPLDTPSAGFAILKSVDGRDNELLMCRTGRILHPAIVEEIFDHAPGVWRHRVIPKADGSLAVMMELMDRQATLGAVMLSKKLSNLLEGYPVTIDLSEKFLSWHPESTGGSCRNARMKSKAGKLTTTEIPFYLLPA